ncbi:MAG: sodium:solute symporter family protein [Bradymonadia bacterium]
MALILCAYVVGLFGLAIWANRKVQGADDFFVAGRKLSLPVSTATLFGTWFGAGTLLAAADEVRADGLRAVAMEPIGAGLCLVVVGLVFARKLWRAKLLTLGDFYRQRFGPVAEWLFALSAATYLGWIAAQLVGMGGVLHTLFDVPMGTAMVITTIIALAYTLIGGMWSVALTDSVQIALLIGGLVWVLISVLSGMGEGDLTAGLDALQAQAPAGHLIVIPTEKAGELWGWVNLLIVGTLGNIAGNDVMQRVFSARSPEVARGACLIAGVGYLVVGVAPALLGVAAAILMPDVATAVLPALAQKVLDPVSSTLFTLALVSAVLSTLDSALLSASTVVARNLVQPLWPRPLPMLKVTRWACVVMAGLSLALAFAGESAFGLLEGSYALTLAGPFVPLLFGLWWGRGGQLAAVASLILGYGITALELIYPEMQPPIPLPLLALGVSAVVYVTLAWWAGGAGPNPEAGPVDQGPDPA